MTWSQYRFLHFFVSFLERLFIYIIKVQFKFDDNVQSFIFKKDDNMALKVHVGLCHPIHVYTLMKKKLSRKLSVLK